MRKYQQTLISHLFSGSIRSILRRWIWELPQTLLGILLSFIFLIRGRVLYAEVAEGVIIMVTKGEWGAISLGNIIIGSSLISPVVGNQLFMHEYGHSIQSRAVGPIYLLIYGLPSLLSVIFRGTNHHKTYVERYANRLAYKHFKTKYFFEHWDVLNYPMV